MATDPDDTLLIFKARGIVKKQADRENEEVNLPKEEKAKFLPKRPSQPPQQEKGEESAQTAPLMSQTSSEKPQEQEGRPTRNFAEIVARKNSARKENQRTPSPQTTQQEQATTKNLYAEQEIKHDLGIPENEAGQERPNATQPKQTKEAARQSRREAKGSYCAWHPWRAAYAMCAYCHRPFCFQDIVELNNLYYCTEDIDIVSHTYKEKVAVASNMVSITAGILMLFAFLVFFYYSNQQVLFILEYINRIGIISFMTNTGGIYLYLLAELLVMILSFIASLLLFSQSRKGFYFGVTISIAVMGLFTDQYAMNAAPYALVIDAMAALSFILLLYYAATRTVIETENQIVNPSYYSTEKGDASKYPNIGKF